MSGHFTGIGAGLAFGDGHVVLGIELYPKVGDLTSVVVERHGNGGEDGLAVIVDKALLH